MTGLVFLVMLVPVVSSIIGVSASEELQEDEFGVEDDYTEADIKSIVIHKEVKVPVIVPVIKKVPFPVRIPVVRNTMKKHLRCLNSEERSTHRPIKLSQIKSYPVKVPHYFPVFHKRTVPCPITRKPPHPVVVRVVNRIPVYIPVVKRVGYPVEKNVPIPVKIPVEKPVPYVVEEPYPTIVEKEVPYPIVKEVPYPLFIGVSRPGAKHKFCQIKQDVSRPAKPTLQYSEIEEIPYRPLQEESHSEIKKVNLK